MHQVQISGLMQGAQGGVGGGWRLIVAPPAATQRVEGGPSVGPATMPAPIMPTNLPPAAATTGTGAAATTSQPAPAVKPPATFFDQVLAVAPLIVMAGLVYVLLFRGKQKEEKKRKNMVAEMKKGDRVMTIGGLIARVVSVDGDDVTLKIDESANVKAVYRKSAIQQVLGGEEKTK